MKWLRLTLVFLISAFPASGALSNDAGFPGRNVNVIGPPPAGSGAIPDKGLRQQNEPSCAVNPTNPVQICCGFNDYRGIDVPEMGDAWEGISCSIDAGNSWESQLIPGHGADPAYDLGLEFAADPNLVAVPGGLFFNYIAADRGHVGGIYVQRYAWRNKEDGWPLIQVGGPVLISKGTSGRFIDKPHMIGFIDDAATTTVPMTWSGGERNLPVGNLGMAAAVFVGNDNNDGTKILYWSSDDWGQTWDQPTKLTESKGVNSGINIAANGDNVCAVWRRFDDTNEVSSILYACSTDRGKRFGRPKVLFETMCPFDQTTLNGVAPAPKDIVSFRSNAFPVIAGDGEKFYVFWSDRGFAAASGFGAGCSLRDENDGFNPSFSRIVYAVTGNNGKNWTVPKPVEDVVPGTNIDWPEDQWPGHQFMPAAFGANGEVIVSWIDSRDDVANLLDVDKQLIVDFWGDTPQGNVALYRHTLDIRAARLVPGSNANDASFTPSIKVSSYARALFPKTDGSGLALRQMEYNLANARLFQKGTAPFIGDYVTVTAKAYNRDANGRWANSNSAPEAGSPVFHIAWGDNRDVRGNAWGAGGAGGFSAPSPYTPNETGATNSSLGDGEQVTNSTPTVEDPADNQQLSCAAAPEKADRTRDQNIYSAALYPLVTMRSPGAVKAANQVQRAMPVYLQNNSPSSRFFRLTIDGQPSDFQACTGVASFAQFPAEGSCPLESVSSLYVKVYPKSSAVRTVFVTSNDELPVIPISAAVCATGSDGQPNPGSCTLVASTTLNNDPLELGQNLEQPDFDSLNSIFASEIHNPYLLNPDLLNPDLLNLLYQNPDLLNALYENPDLLNPELPNSLVTNETLLNLIVANYDLLNPDLLNILIENPDLLNLQLLNSLVANPDLLNPDLLNSTVYNVVVANPDLLNPDLLNIMVENPDLLNPDLLNPDLLNLQLLNPDLLNPDLLNPDLLNPDLLNPDLLNQLIANPDLLNPDLLNPDLLNPDLLNPDLLNPDLLNPDLLNPDLLNPDLLNPDLLNPDLLNPDLLNAVLEYSDLENPDAANDDLNQNAKPEDYYIDVTWQVRNDGNTTTGYMAQPFVTGPEDEYSATQLIVSKPYLRRTTRDCQTVVVSDNQVVVNIYDPPTQAPIINPDPTQPEVQGLASYWLAPGEVANVTLRIFGDPANLKWNRAGLYVNSEACNTDEVCDDQPFELTRRNPDFTGPLLDPETINVTVPYYIEAANQDGGYIQYEKPTAFDEGDGTSVPVTCTFEPGSLVGFDDSFNTCSAEDAGGNTTETSFEFEVTDTTAPFVNFVAPEGFLPVEATSPAGAEIDYQSWASPSDLVDLEPDLSCDGPEDNWFALGDTVVSCTATDDFNNSSTETVTVTVVDTTIPVVIVPLFSVDAEATSPAGAAVTFEVSANDIADSELSPTCTTATGVVVSGDTFALGTTEVSCTATDDSGNTGSATFNVVITDTTVPTVTVPGVAVEAEATGPDGAIATFDVSATDIADSDPLLECSAASGDVFPLGTTTVSCTATDDSGNVGTAEFNVVITDTTDPVVTVPAFAVEVESTGPDGTVATFEVSATDIADSDPLLECSAASGDIFPLGTTLVTCSATDDSGNVGTAEFNVVVTDITDPVVTVPAFAVEVEATGPGGAVATFEVSATDIADSDPLLECSAASGGVFPLGTTLVTCSATDDSGNVGTAEFNVVVTDTTDPVVTVPAFGVEVEATGPDGAVATFEVSATDIADTDPLLQCSAASGDVFPVGKTTVTCSATDDSNNSSSAAFDVIVSDTIAPVLAVPNTIVAEAVSPGGSVVNYSVDVFDAVSLSLVAVCSPTSGSTFGIASTTVSCSAEDGAGNLGTAAFVVQIIDTTAPVITMPAPLTTEATSPAGALVEYEAGVSDIADTDPQFSCSPASGDQFGIGDTTVTCLSQDKYGNSSSASSLVSVVDTTPPVLGDLTNIEVSAESESGSFVTFTVTATDIADAEVDISCTPASGSEFGIGTTEVNCTATDDAGLTDEGTFTVSVYSDIIWIEPTDPAFGSIGPNFNFRWGYGADGVLFNSSGMIDRPSGKGTAPLVMTYQGENCGSGQSDLVDLDAGKSSLRYSQGEWLLNWQTGQSELNGGPLIAGCYELAIPRAAGQGAVDTKEVLLTE